MNNSRHCYIIIMIRLLATIIIVKSERYSCELHCSFHEKEYIIILEYYIVLWYYCINIFSPAGPCHQYSKSRHSDSAEPYRTSTSHNRFTQGDAILLSRNLEYTNIRLKITSAVQRTFIQVRIIYYYNMYI